MSRIDTVTQVESNGRVDSNDGNPSVMTRRPLSAYMLVAAISAYQSARSGRPTGCRYLPTCSEYAIEAIDVHGTVRGTALAVRRIARCTPWGGHGIDPVPDRRAP
jgi:uncharacterized protein